MLFPGRELPPSVMSLPLLVYRLPVDDRAPVMLDQGTGFLVRHQEQLYLITNWHVVTGRKPVTGENNGGSSSLPEYLEVSFPFLLGGDLYWTLQRLDLYDTHTRKARWLVHPYAPPMEGGTDVIALPIDKEPPSVYAYSLEDALDPRELSPGAELSIVGYPFKVNPSTAIWTRATVASEPRHGFEDDPVYLVDARSRPGQSGSPVLAADSRLGIDGHGNSVGGGWTLAGVYAGRVRDDLDLGRVWWPVVIREILQHMQPDRLSFE
jgi:hypothetical protein